MMEYNFKVNFEISNNGEENRDDYLLIAYLPGHEHEMDWILKQCENGIYSATINEKTETLPSTGEKIVTHKLNAN